MDESAAQTREFSRGGAADFYIWIFAVRLKITALMECCFKIVAILFLCTVAVPQVILTTLLQCRKLYILYSSLSEQLFGC